MDHGGWKVFVRPTREEAALGEPVLHRNRWPPSCPRCTREMETGTLSDSPWFFPSPDNPSNAAGPTALARALLRLDDKGCGHKVTSHGLRAFYVLVRRSQGATDACIAAELGHQTGGSTVERVYRRHSVELVEWRRAEPVVAANWKAGLDYAGVRRYAGARKQPGRGGLITPRDRPAYSSHVARSETW